MTEKLYYSDSHCRSFEAQVLRCRRAGERWEILLDRTAFFPGGGGQEADSGSLEGVRVLGMAEREGEILHLCAGPLPEGSRIRGELDWPLRFQRMQFHSGEHILSGLAHSLYGCDNVGFHMSEGFVTVDLSRELTEPELRNLERRVNEAIWENLPVRCWFPDEAELAAADYRSKKALSGAVRLAEIPGVDCCACCAPHVKSTGEIGLLQIRDSMRHRGGVRLTLLAGAAAYENAARQTRDEAALSALLSAPREALPPAVEKLHGELEETRFALQGLRLAAAEARAAAIAPTEGNLCLFESAGDMNALRALANLCAEKSRLAAVFAGEDGDYKYIIASRRVNLRAEGRAINAAIEGRGGGNELMLQGSARGSRAAIEAYFGGSHGQS